LELTETILVKKFSVSVATFLVYCLVIFIFISDGFELLGETEAGSATAMQRGIQFFVAMPIAFGFLYCLHFNPIKLLTPLGIYLLIRLCIDIITQQKAPFLLEDMLIIFALFILNTLPKESIFLAIRLIIKITAACALLALIKIVVVLLVPSLANSPSLSWMGRSTEVLNIGPLIFGRSSSFVKEPSLNVLFFIMPAILSIFIYNTYKTKYFLILMTFSILSFSGSVFLAVIVAIIAIILMKINKRINVKVFFPYAILLALAVYFGILNTIQNSNIAESLDFSTVNEGFNKSESFQIRATFSSINYGLMKQNPLGLGYANPKVINIPNPLLVSVGISGGYISICLFLLYFFKMSDLMNRYKKQLKSNFISIVGLGLLIGALFNFLVFNDYLIINYTGMVMLTLTYLFFKFTVRPSFQPPLLNE
jgi:hypothetical protein